MWLPRHHPCKCYWRIFIPSTWNISLVMWLCCCISFFYLALLAFLSLDQFKLSVYLILYYSINFSHRPYHSLGERLVNFFLLLSLILLLWFSYKVPLLFFSNQGFNFLFKFKALFSFMVVKVEQKIFAFFFFLISNS